MAIRDRRKGLNRLQLESRFAQDGKLYVLKEFVKYYGPEKGRYMWDYALPQDLAKANDKLDAVVQTYEAITAQEHLPPGGLVYNGDT